MKRRLYRVWTKDNPSEEFEPCAGDPESGLEARRRAEVLRDHGVLVKVLPEVTEALGDWT